MADSFFWFLKRMFSLRIFFIAGILISFFGFIPNRADAALLYFDPSNVEVYRGDTITIGLRLDTEEDECINAVDAVIHYDESIRAIDVSRGKSILNIWVEDPVIDETNHTIRFAGGIPGGYCGRIPGDPSLTNVLLEVVFRSPGFSIGAAENPSARVWLGEESQAFLHDGFGTGAVLRLQDARVNLLSTPGDVSRDEWRGAVLADKEDPADFIINLTRDISAFSNKYFIVFSTVDKQSGIDHYEVMEEPLSELNTFKWGRADAPWVEVESPYVLKDQTLNSTIRVKAIDKSGNSRIATLVPEEAIRGISADRLITLLVVGGVVFFLVVLIGYALWKRRQRIMNEEDV